MNNASCILSQIDDVFESAFFCPLTTSFSRRITKAQEASKTFELDTELTKEYSKTAVKLLTYRNKKSGEEKTIKNLQNKMQFLHMLIFKKFKKEHPGEVNAYEKYQACLYDNLTHLDNFIFEPEWVKASQDFFGIGNLLGEVERVTLEAEGRLPELSEDDTEKAEELGEKLTKEILCDKTTPWKNDRSFRKFLREELLPKHPLRYHPYLYITLYKEFCVLTMEYWVME